jgi:hypothetical protein
MIVVVAHGSACHGVMHADRELAPIRPAPETSPGTGLACRTRTSADGPSQGVSALPRDPAHNRLDLHRCMLSSGRGHGAPYWMFGVPAPFEARCWRRRFRLAYGELLIVLRTFSGPLLGQSAAGKNHNSRQTSRESAS